MFINYECEIYENLYSPHIMVAVVSKMNTKLYNKNTKINFQYY